MVGQEVRLGGSASRVTWQGTALFGMEGLSDDRRHGYTIGHLEVKPDGTAETTLWPRMAVKRQTDQWTFTADASYELKDDLLATAPEPATPLQALPCGAAAPSPSPGPAPPRTWREAVERSALWPAADPQVTQARRMAVEIAAACRAVWDTAEREVPGDPWRDEDLPLRTLDRLRELVPRGALNATEAALVLVAPFVREALFAAGAQWLEAELPKDHADNLARRIVNEMHLARPDLVRRLEKLTGTDRAAVERWLHTRALRQCPQLWDDDPRLGPARALMDEIARIHREHGLQVGAKRRLMQMVRHVGVSPEIFQAEESIDEEPVIWAGALRLRLSALARLLCTAGAWALELRRAEDLVADHVGREGFEAATAREALRSACWEGPRLVHRCSDPVVDFVLRDDLLRAAEWTMQRLIDDRDRDPKRFWGLVDRLPVRLHADIEIEKGPDGRPRYQVPHVRFQLDHNQVRELLMGEQLYGNPTLAVREMYQNALDACRYRQARIEYLRQIGKWYENPYEGRIVFRQGVDAAGRAYVSLSRWVSGSPRRTSTTSRRSPLKTSFCFPAISTDKRRGFTKSCPFLIWPRSRPISNFHARSSPAAGKTYLAWSSPP